jgi:hypothetical protein
MADGIAETVSLQFKSEDDRLTALNALPDEPPSGANVDGWLREIEDQKQAIMNAPVVPEAPSEPQPASATPPVPSQVAPSGYNQPVTQAPQAPVAPEPPPTPTEPQAAPTDEDVVFVYPDGTKVLRKDLPEELRQYKSPGEIIKQFGHARTYANTAEERLRKQSAEIEELRTKTQQLPELEKQLGELKQRLTTTASTTAELPGQSEAGKAATKSRMKELKEQIASLEQLSPEDLLAEPEKLDLMKRTMASLGGELDRYDGEIARIRETEVANSQKYDELAKRVESVSQTSQQELERQKRIATTNAAIRQVTQLQDAHPELKTSKPVFGTETDVTPTVEKAVWQFAEKIMLARDGRKPASWSEANAIINAYNRNDQNLRSFISANGISPKDVGCNDNDFLSYATILNVDAMTRGEKIDELTGKKVVMTSEINGQQVNFPNHKAAFEYLLSSTGYAKAMRERMLADAELLGQTNVIESVQRSSAQPKTIGKDGTMASDEAAGGVMSKEDAERILSSTDEYEMDRRAGSGDRTMFKLYQAAQRALGLPESIPESHWPPEKRT